MPQIQGYQSKVFIWDTGGTTSIAPRSDLPTFSAWLGFEMRR